MAEPGSSSTATKTNKNSNAKRWSLTSMNALVTGGTRGIGHAVVEELAALGASVHTCSRSETELDKCLKEWAAKGFCVTGSVCDVSSREQRQKLMEYVDVKFDGKLHILVNNAGTNFRKPTVQYTAEEISTIMCTNFESAYHLCQMAHPLMKNSGAGSIVFVSSVAGVVSLGTGSPYAASKGNLMYFVTDQVTEVMSLASRHKVSLLMFSAALNQITKNLACEWAKDNIRVNTVAPWYIQTSLVEHLLGDEEFLEKVISRTPLGRPGEADEVSSLVAYLCLAAASYITGRVICQWLLPWDLLVIKPSALLFAYHGCAMHIVLLALFAVNYECTQVTWENLSKVVTNVLGVFSFGFVTLVLKLW